MYLTGGGDCGLASLAAASGRVCRVVRVSGRHEEFTSSRAIIEVLMESFGTPWERVEDRVTTIFGV